MQNFLKQANNIPRFQGIVYYCWLPGSPARRVKKFRFFTPRIYRQLPNAEEISRDQPCEITYLPSANEPQSQSVNSSTSQLIVPLCGRQSQRSPFHPLDSLRIHTLSPLTLVPNIIHFNRVAFLLLVTLSSSCPTRFACFHFHRKNQHSPPPGHDDTLYKPTDRQPIESSSRIATSRTWARSIQSFVMSSDALKSIPFPIPTLDKPFGVELWPIFSEAYTKVMGYPPSAFYFVPNQTPISTLKATTTMLTTYYVVVFAGRELMKKREPFKLNALFMIHNLYLTIASAIMLALFVEQLISTVWRRGVFFAICDHRGGWTRELVVLYYVGPLASQQVLRLLTTS